MPPNLPALGRVKTISLYVHVPFCMAKCDYCDFFSLPGEPEDVQQKVVEQIIAQGRIMLARLGNPLVETVYIGGGTPTVLSGKALTFLLSELMDLIGSHPAEFTCEANPETITPEVLKILFEGGITRLSLGIQSFNDTILEFLGRTSSTALSNKQALNSMRDYWQGKLSIDLIADIPDRTADSLHHDIDTALSWNPQHISIYSLHVERDTPLYGRVSGILENDNSGYSFQILPLYLEEQGFHRYEVSNYALPGEECLHNRAYWKMKPYLGIGPGAVSTLPGGSGIFRSGIYRIENVRDLPSYLSGTAPWYGSAITEITPGEFLTEFCMMNLRLTEGISFSRFARIFNLRFEDVFAEIIDEWNANGYAATDTAGVGLTPEGIIFLNRLLLQLMERIETLSSLSVHWPSGNP